MGVPRWVIPVIGELAVDFVRWIRRRRRLRREADEARKRGKPC
jgi:hypothetical protein